MNLLKHFNTQVIPFSLLTSVQLDYMQRHVDIGYFQAQQTIISIKGQSAGLHLIIKGKVSESELDPDTGQPVHALVHYGQSDYFGVWSALRGSVLHDFIATEETLCYILPVENLRFLMEKNAAFGEYFDNTSLRQSFLGVNEHAQDGHPLLSTVEQSCMQPILLINHECDLRHVTVTMREKKVDCALVKRGNRYGMITRTNLLDALVIDNQALQSSAQAIANYRLFSIKPNDYLFNALVMMTEQEIDRVVVMKGGTPLGLVELTDALSYFSSQAHSVGIAIERANTILQLKLAAQEMQVLVRSLHNQGIKTRFLMDLLAALNKRLMAKLFNIMVPEDMMPHVCLVVMGSEGRAEQILKTDQDNGLIIRDNLNWPAVSGVMQEYSRALEKIGFPPCEGGVMVNNPVWVQPISQWIQKMEQWMQVRDEDSLMNLSITVDAAPIAGNPALFKASRNWLLRALPNYQACIADLARLTMIFDTPLNILGGIRSYNDTLDLKRGGIFPIVHGIRTLALAHGITATNTFIRIDLLVQQGHLPTTLGHNLQEAFSVFHWLRLKHNLGTTATAKQTLQEQVPDYTNIMTLDTLDSLEKDTLRQALKEVKVFKRHLALRFQLSHGL